MTLSNQERSVRCRMAITDYSDDDHYTNLVDFLADAMHWSHANGHSFLDALDTARMHFEAEMEGDDILDDLNHHATNRKEQPMKRFHVTVIIKTLEVYRVESENEDDAEENWADGILIRTDDGALESEILSVEEAKP